MNFDRVAPFYRTLETIMFGGSLQRARIRWICELDKPRRALIAGEGDGRFVCQLIRAYPQLEIDCVDASARMLALTEQRLRVASVDIQSQVRLLPRDILRWTPSGSYDLVVTHFFLDCFDAEEASEVVAKIARAAAADATWLLADFTVPDHWPGRGHAQIWLRVMYAFFRFAAGLRTKKLVDPTGDLEAAGFVCREREQSRLGLLKSEMWVRARE